MYQRGGESDAVFGAVKLEIENREKTVIEEFSKGCRTYRTCSTSFSTSHVERGIFRELRSRESFEARDGSEAETEVTRQDIQHGA